jgi:hypothetical protein
MLTCRCNRQGGAVSALLNWTLLQGNFDFIFRQDLQDQLDLIFNFQFPDETENTESAYSGNKL